MFCCNCGQEIGEAYIKQLIREELAHLDPDTANKLTDQVATRLGNRARMYGQVRTFETKVKLHCDGIPYERIMNVERIEDEH